MQTVDFFTPIVDDPYLYGQIAAANSLSDVYAMGGRPLTALAIAAFPATGLETEDIAAIFRGGFDTLQKAGVALLGGHTVKDSEIKFGYAVTGLAGETQDFDGNGPYIRFQTGGGSFGTNGGLVSSPNAGGGFRDEVMYGRAQSAPLATQPVQGSKPPFRTDTPCYVNPIPDLNGPAAAPGPPSPAAVP